MTTAAIALLQLRLTQLGYDGAVATADDCRTAILSALCEYAVCGRVNGRTKTFGQVYELCFGHAIDKREKTKRGVAK